MKTTTTRKWIMKRTITTMVFLVCLLALALSCNTPHQDEPPSLDPSQWQWYTNPGLPNLPVMYTLPYLRADLNGEIYKVTIQKKGCHTGDVVFSCQIDNVWHLYRVTSQGETIDTFTYDWSWGGARLLENGNYLMGDVSKKILEVAPSGKIVWELDTEGKGIGPSHHIKPLPNGNFLLDDCELDKFVEITREGEIIFEWCAKDHLKKHSPDTYVGYEILGAEAGIYSIYANIQEIEGWPILDWTHINFAQKLDNGNYIASLAKLDLVIEIDGTNGEIVWSYGPGILKRQHTPIVYGNHMYIFDNGNGRVIKVNRNTGRIVLEIKGLVAPIWGDVRRLPNDNLLITDCFRNRAVEVNEKTGEIIWEIQMCSVQGGVWAEETQ